MNARINNLFFVSVAMLLFLTGAGKLYSATGTAKLLSLADPGEHHFVQIGIADDDPTFTLDSDPDHRRNGFARGNSSDTCPLWPHQTCAELLLPTSLFLPPGIEFSLNRFHLRLSSVSVR